MICKKTVMRLYRRGKTYKEIAGLLKCSEKQVGRIVRAEVVEMDKEMHKWAKRDHEDVCWYAIASGGTSLNKIAIDTGVSVQYVEQQITPYLK